MLSRPRKPRGKRRCEPSASSSPPVNPPRAWSSGSTCRAFAPRNGKLPRAPTSVVENTTFCARADAFSSAQSSVGNCPPPAKSQKRGRRPLGADRKTSNAITFAPARRRLSITRAWRSRPNGQRSGTRSSVSWSTPTTTRSSGAGSAPRIEKRASTVLSSSERNVRVRYAASGSATASAAAAASSSTRMRRRRLISGRRGLHDQGGGEERDEVQALVHALQHGLVGRRARALHAPYVGGQQPAVVLHQVRQERRGEEQRHAAGP